MPTQLSILDECQYRTERAIEQVDMNADVKWKVSALEAISEVAMANEYFSSNDLWPHLDQPREPRAMGAVIRTAQSLQWIVATTTFITSNRPTQHNQPIRVWRSLIHQKNEE